MLKVILARAPLAFVPNIPNFPTTNNKSKETHGQTHGLSNLEIKHVGKLAIIIIGALLLKAVKTSCTYKT